MRKSHGDALRGSEAVFPVENHAVAAIEKDDSGAGAVVFALMYHQIGVGHLDGNFCALAADSVEQSLADIEIQRVAKFVGAGDASGFDAGGEVARIVAS